ncbi:MAG: hypothetical protein HOP33_21685 [Verrucomicrobia bacterium]|nr:hypothetical protein [Verrucomicrobiota bacterium]
MKSFPYKMAVCIGAVCVATPLILIAAFVVGEIQYFHDIQSGMTTANALTRLLNPLLLSFGLASVLYPTGLFLLGSLAKRRHFKAGRFWMVLVVLGSILFLIFPLGTGIALGSIIYLKRNKDLFVSGNQDVPKC